MMREMFWRRILALGRFSAQCRSVPIRFRMIGFHAMRIGGVVMKPVLQRRATGRVVSHIVSEKKRFSPDVRLRVLAPSVRAWRYGQMLSAVVRTVQNTHAERSAKQVVLPLVAKRSHGAFRRGLIRGVEALGAPKAKDEDVFSSRVAPNGARESLTRRHVSGRSLRLPQKKSDRRIAARKERVAGVPSLRRNDARQDFREVTDQGALRRSVQEADDFGFQGADAAIAKAAVQSESDWVAFGTGESRRRLAARRAGSGVDEIKQPQYLGCSIGYC